MVTVVNKMVYTWNLLGIGLNHPHHTQLPGKQVAEGETLPVQQVPSPTPHVCAEEKPVEFQE